MSVARSMVARQAGHDNRPRPDHSAACPRAFDDLAETDQRNLRRIDHAEDGLDALIAETGNRDGRVGDFGTAKHAGAHALNQIAQARHDFAEVLLADVVNRRRDKAALPDRYRDADVNRLAGFERTIDPEAVHLGYLVCSE